MFQVPSFCEQKPNQTILQNLNKIKSTLNQQDLDFEWTAAVIIN